MLLEVNDNVCFERSLALGTVEENNRLVGRKRLIDDRTYILDFGRSTALPVELPNAKAVLAVAECGQAKFNDHNNVEGKYGKTFILCMPEFNSEPIV